MRKIIYKISITGFLLIFISTNLYITVRAENEKIILLDAGHGGIDGGAVGFDGTLEKDINLIICKKVEQMLIKNGYAVVLTRDDDNGLYTDEGTIRKKKIEDLNNRNKLIFDSQCHMFLSIHQNVFPQKKYYGAQVWYGDNDKSLILGNLLQQNLREHLDKNNERQAKCAKQDYIVIRNIPEIPVAIIECGFMSNNTELSNLKDDQYQQKIAESICAAVNKYFSN